MAQSLRDIIKTNLDVPVRNIFDTNYSSDALINAAAAQYAKFEGKDISKFVPARKTEKLWEWYSGRYPSAKAETSADRANSRNVSRTTSEDTYDFHIPYKAESFKRNLLGTTFPSSEFIQHICAAFFIGRETCNQLLTTYGYLPLHEKNLHNLAVYSVLSNIDTLGGNPLELIRNRYFKAREILIEICGNDPIVMQTIETLLLAEELGARPDFTEEHYLNYVRKNAVYLTRRHSALLKEHSRLVNVFQDLYDIRRKMPLNTRWSETEGVYSLFSFVTLFCLNLQYNNFKDRLIKEIRKDGEVMERANRHPTREIMILLWLYEEFFRNSPPILCPPKYASVFPKEYRTVRTISPDETKTELDIHRLLFGTAPSRGSRKIRYNRNPYTANVHFDGPEAHRLINEKLKNYGYNPLTLNCKFDLLIMKFFSLKIYQFWDSGTAEYSCDFFEEQQILLRDDPDFSDAVFAYEEYRVPLALSMFFKILGYARKMGESLSGEKNPKKHPREFLLECRLNSQI
ncbi:MAG: hypothetical protein IKU40_04555 [Clostridia bacterium]|nr:hypothetical protein [Clostridia bacterium]